MTMSPGRRQFLEIKARYPNTIVLFRMGDFYETFDDDARVVAKELEIVLTARQHGDEKIPLAGFPYHALNNQLRRLVGRGYRVAICEQIEDPKKTKKLVQRDVVRVVTPGTVVEEDLLGKAANNYLVAVAPGRSSNGLAYVDITTGEFCAAEASDADLTVELARLAPAEVLLPEGLDLPSPVEAPLTPFDARLFRLDDADERLREHFKVASMEGYGLRRQSPATAAAGAILAYLGDNQKAALANVKDLEVYSPARYLVIDANARRHLELFTSLRDGTKNGALIGAIDATQTAMGARLLARWLGQPLLDVAEIDARLDRVEAYYSDGVRRATTRERLRDTSDVERICGRITAGATTPRDLAALRRALNGYPALLAAAGYDEGASAGLQTAAEAAALLDASIADEPAVAVGEGGVIRSGFSQDLDEARTLTGDVRRALAELEAEEKERTGIRSLRVAYNRVFGYYLEVSKANLAMVPDDFQRKQTLVGAERFITPRLKDLEDRILAAREAIGELEASLFRQVCAQLAASADGLKAVAQTIAEIDVYSALAETAAKSGYVRPVLDEGTSLEIHDGRHPVVERNLGDGRFVPNDTVLDSADAQIVVLTGPNMAGKSTYLRQVALITLLAQIGSFVPASSARVGIVDRVFTRIGAQDDLSRGESTFMVEMLETAAILRGATDRSLVLFDEVGRGTSTYDGLAIARAVVEYLHSRPERAAKTLFATHYHELTQLASMLPRVRNYSVAVSETDGQVVFLHRIVEGGADRSYGIHVAELAGMPAPIVARAREVLASLEDGARSGKTARRAEPTPQLAMPLFVPRSAVEEELEAIDPDALTPREALSKLYELKTKLKGS
ncbi:MAG: DNA mismatch repair protein MutS [Dehalococcoidia bacterium]